MKLPKGAAGWQRLTLCQITIPGLWYFLRYHWLKVKREKKKKNIFPTRGKIFPFFSRKADSSQFHVSGESCEYCVSIPILMLLRTVVYYMSTCIIERDEDGVETLVWKLNIVALLPADPTVGEYTWAVSFWSITPAVTRAQYTLLLNRCITCNSPLSRE